MAPGIHELYHIFVNRELECMVNENNTPKEKRAALEMHGKCAGQEAWRAGRR